MPKPKARAGPKGYFLWSQRKALTAILFIWAILAVCVPITEPVLSYAAAITATELLLRALPHICRDNNANKALAFFRVPRKHHTILLKFLGHPQARLLVKPYISMSGRAWAKPSLFTELTESAGFNRNPRGLHKAMSRNERSQVIISAWQVSHIAQESKQPAPWNGISHRFSPEKPAGSPSHFQRDLELHRLDSAQLLLKYCEGSIYITHHTAHHCCPHSHCHHHSATGCEYSIHSDMRTHLPHIPLELQGHNRDKVKARRFSLQNTKCVTCHKSSNIIL